MVRRRYVHRSAGGRPPISVFATNTRPNWEFHLMAGPDGPGPFPEDWGCADGTRIHPSGRWSSARGLIRPTFAVLDVPPGNYDICFVAVPDGARGHVYATIAVFLTAL